MTLDENIGRWLRRRWRDIEASLVPQSSGPRMPAGLSLRYMQLTTALPAGNGSTVLGHGKGKIMKFTPGATATANGTLAVPSGAATVDVYGILTPGLKSGSTILVAKVDGAWQYVLTLCTNVSS